MLFCGCVLSKSKFQARAHTQKLDKHKTHCLKKLTRWNPNRETGRDPCATEVLVISSASSSPSPGAAPETDAEAEAEADSPSGAVSVVENDLSGSTRKLPMPWCGWSPAEVIEEVEEAGRMNSSMVLEGWCLGPFVWGGHDGALNSHTEI